METQCRPYNMKALDAGCSGIHYQHVSFRIPHDFQDMGMSADEEIRTIFVYKPAGARIITAGIASDMGHEHFHSLTFKEPVKRMNEPEVMVVTIAGNTLQWLEGGNLSRQIHPPAEITGMPDLIDRLQKFTEWSIKNAVGI